MKTTKQILIRRDGFNNYRLYWWPSPSHCTAAVWFTVILQQQGTLSSLTQTDYWYNAAIVYHVCSFVLRFEKTIIPDSETDNTQRTGCTSWTLCEDIYKKPVNSIFKTFSSHGTTASSQGQQEFCCDIMINGPMSELGTTFSIWGREITTSRYHILLNGTHIVRSMTSCHQSLQHVIWSRQPWTTFS